MNVYTFEDIAPVTQESEPTYQVIAFDSETRAILGSYIGPSKDEAHQYEINFINNGCKRVLTHEQCNMLIAEWNQADQQQKFWREKELQLRAALVAEKYTKESGTERIDLDAGWQLVIERGLDYKLENKNNETADIVDELPEGTEALLIKWTPELKSKNYNDSSDEIKALFKPVLTIKPASPQVKLVPPKASKG